MPLSAVTVPLPHLELAVVPVMVGIDVTVAITAVLDEETQPLFVASA
jgi:hypothetical protein